MKDIIFDFGGVLIDWNPRYLYKKVFASEEEMEWFLNNVCTSQWNTQQDAGRPFAQGIALLTQKYPKYTPQIEDYYKRWDEMLGGAVKGTPDILKELQSKGYKVYGLTNWSAETFHIAYERFDFLRTLDGIVVSGEEKLVKPDPKIYERLLARFNLRAPNCVFIDDNAANVTEAARLGFEAIEFKEAGQLSKELLHLGIL